MTAEPEEEKKKRKWSECVRFYITALSVVTACLSSFAFLFLVPFVIDPGFSTIFAEFDETPVKCVTTYSESFFSMSNCSWSSCREGCTNELIKCVQIHVNYFNDTENTYDDLEYMIESQFTKVDWMFQDARLYPNVKGCGYPPDVNCTVFNDTYSAEFRIYPCFYSKIQSDLVLTTLDLEKTKLDLIYAIAIPWGAFIISMLYLILTYCGMKKPEDDDVMSRDDIHSHSAKASKEASNYSLRSIGKTINHGVNKFMGPDDKGDGADTSKDDKSAILIPKLDSKLLLAPTSLEHLNQRKAVLSPMELTPNLPRVSHYPKSNQVPEISFSNERRQSKDQSRDLILTPANLEGYNPRYQLPPINSCTMTRPNNNS